MGCILDLNGVCYLYDLYCSISYQICLPNVYFIWIILYVYAIYLYMYVGNVCMCVLQGSMVEQFIAECFYPEWIYSKKIEAGR